MAREECPGYEFFPELSEVYNDVFDWCIMHPKGKLDPVKGLWIEGSIGTGKSTLLRIVRRFCGMVRPMQQHRNGSAPMPYSFRITSALKVAAAYGKQGFAGLDDFIDNPCQAIDDLGCEPDTVSYYGASLNPLEFVMLGRYDVRHGDFTHVTTNLTAEEAMRRYGARVMDRCVEMFNFVTMQGPSCRE